MSAIVVPGRRGRRWAPVAPRRPDGGWYRFELVFDGGAARAYADTVTDLCGLVCPGYAQLADPADQTAARLRAAVDTQVWLQAVINASHPAFDRLQAPQRALLEGVRHRPPAVKVWRAAVPLVLVAAYYRPHAELARPVGRPAVGTADSNLVWLDPSDELTLLTSLHSAGVLQLHTSDPAGRPEATTGG